MATRVTKRFLGDDELMRFGIVYPVLFMLVAQFLCHRFW